MKESVSKSVYQYLHDGGRIQIDIIDLLFEIRYYRTAEEKSPLFWSMRLSTANELARLWALITGKTGKVFPVIRRNEECEIRMNSPDCLLITEINYSGRLVLPGIELPLQVVEAVVSVVKEEGPF